MAQPDTRVETAQPPKRFAGWPPKLGQRFGTVRANGPKNGNTSVGNRHAFRRTQADGARRRSLPGRRRTMSRAKKQRGWSYSTGERGRNRVRVFTRPDRDDEILLQ